ncbi:MAG: hypothetical protein R3190_18755, partial [Thermoanaerobaculia bacterium]|nr:hypothetical protein [Thermoanaerobaculia bacterium]
MPFTERLGSRSTRRFAIALAAPALALAGLVLTAAAAGQAPDPVADLLSEHRWLIEGAGDDLSGPGLDFLVREGAASELFLIGESHNTDEIPRLTSRLAVELRAHGYGALAIETGPLTAEWMVADLRAGGIEQLNATLTAFPFTVPFFDRVPEAELLATSLRHGYEIWGLDQEFIGSGRYWLKRLERLAPTEAAGEVVASWFAREMEAAAHYQQTESTERLVLSSASPEEFEELATLFTDVPEGHAIVEAMAKSAHIYQLWRSANYANNRDRVLYMKRNLIARLGEHGG